MGPHYRHPAPMMHPRVRMSPPAMHPPRYGDGPFRDLGPERNRHDRDYRDRRVDERSGLLAVTLTNDVALRTLYVALSFLLAKCTLRHRSDVVPPKKKPWLKAADVLFWRNHGTLHVELFLGRFKFSFLICEASYRGRTAVHEPCTS